MPIALMQDPSENLLEISKQGLERELCCGQSSSSTESWASLQPSGNRSWHNPQLVWNGIIILLQLARQKLSFWNKIASCLFPEWFTVNRKEKAFILFSWKLQRDDFISTLMQANFLTNKSTETNSSFSVHMDQRAELVKIQRELSYFESSLLKATRVHSPCSEIQKS